MGFFYNKNRFKPIWLGFFRFGLVFSGFFRFGFGFFSFRLIKPKLNQTVFFEILIGFVGYFFRFSRFFSFLTLTPSVERWETAARKYEDKERNTWYIFWSWKKVISDVNGFILKKKSHEHSMEFSSCQKKKKKKSRLGKVLMMFFLDV